MENRTRPGYSVVAKAGNFDFKIINLHFKSTSRYDNTDEKRQLSYDLRKEQALELNRWIKTQLDSTEKDIIILGDLNDNPNRTWSDNLEPLKTNQDIVFITEGLESCKNPNWDNIDHIILSRSAEKRYIKGSAGMYNFNIDHPKKTANLISDHCPVIATFEISSPDND